MLLFLLNHHLLLVVKDLSVVVDEDMHVVFLIPVDHGLVLVLRSIVAQRLSHL